MGTLAGQSNVGSSEVNFYPVNLSAVIIAPSSLLDVSLLMRARRSVEFADEVIIHRLNDSITDFSNARNNALIKTRGEWVLFVDSDEEVTPELAAEIRKTVQKDSGIQGYFVKRDDWFLGKKLQFGETARVWLLRMARRGSGQWVRPVHERWAIRGKIAKFRNPFIHHGHVSVISMFEKIEHYAAIEAAYRQRVRPVGLSRAMVEMSVFPKAKFALNYILRLGCLDGFPGLIIALMMSFHSFLVRAHEVELWMSKR